MNGPASLGGGRRTLRLSVLVSLLIGFSAAAVLIATNNVGQIARAVMGAGWGILAVVALHLPQIFFSALGWRVLIDDPHRPAPITLIKLRWIREAVNALLPVAQIGGEFVRARLLALRGVGLKSAAASVTVDLTVEMLSQAVFTLLGLALLLVGLSDRMTARWLVAVAAVGIGITLSFLVSQRFGVFRLIERALLRFADRSGWSSLGDISGLSDAIVALYRDPRRFWRAAAYHLVSWLLGTVETMAALWVLGIHAGIREALIIESLGQAVRAAGFAIPGALGVQEGGYILICGLFGIAPGRAIALSLLRRIRELALGVPALVVWHEIEGRRLARRSADRRAAARRKQGAS